MKSTEMLNQIKTLLNIEVKLEEQKLENGTRVEAESFEKGKEIFILTETKKIKTSGIQLMEISTKIQILNSMELLKVKVF